MLGRENETRVGPTHVCLHCGEWWDVEREGKDLWQVAAHQEDDGQGSKVWAEAAGSPVCPIDTTSLDEFLIAE